MGQTIRYTCPNCGYSFTEISGVGFMFPMVYEETVSKMKNGEMGEEARKFFAEHPDGAVDCNYVTLKCTKCGKRDSRRDLTMYIPKEGYEHKVPEGIWSVSMPSSGCDYVSDYELEKNYTEYQKYPHKCEKCGGNMETLSDGELEICPKCGCRLEETALYFWD